MNGMKALKGTAVALSLAALTACGQSYSPSPDEHVAAPQGGGDVFGSGTDNTTYRTASFEVLKSTLIDVMGVSDMATPLTGAMAVDCPAATQAAGCPKWLPIAYLTANAGALGAAVYNQADPLATQAPGLMTSGGFKAWVLAASSGSGLMMTQGSKLFPNGVTDYTYMYQALLGRSPTQAEIDRLNAVEAAVALVPANASLNSTQLQARQGAAAASSVLGSLEFLMVN